jgi:hypothetical protein
MGWSIRSVSGAGAKNSREARLICGSIAEEYQQTGLAVARGVRKKATAGLRKSAAAFD